MMEDSAQSFITSWSK